MKKNYEIDWYLSQEYEYDEGRRKTKTTITKYYAVYVRKRFGGLTQIADKFLTINEAINYVSGLKLSDASVKKANKALKTLTPMITYDNICREFYSKSGYSGYFNSPSTSDFSGYSGDSGNFMFSKEYLDKNKGGL